MASVPPESRHRPAGQIHFLAYLPSTSYSPQSLALLRSTVSETMLFFFSFFLVGQPAMTALGDPRLPCPYLASDFLFPQMDALIYGLREETSRGETHYQKKGDMCPWYVTVC